MKANAYIVKRVYIERNSQREYESHLERMKTIRPTMSQNLNQVEIKQNQKRSISSHVRAQKFKEVEKQREEKIVNKALINKLLDISDGKFSMMKKTTSTMNIMHQTDRPKRQDSSNQEQSNKNDENNQLNQNSVDQRPESQQLEKDNKGSKTIKRQRGNSEHNASRKLDKSQMVAQNSLHNIIKKKEIERIAIENSQLAQRMIKLPPVIQKAKLDQEYKENKKLKDMVRKFHQYEGKRPQNLTKKLKTEEEQIEDGLDENIDELMNQKVHVVIRLIDISFINFLPVNWEEEKYFLEIKAGNKPMKKTTPEMYMDFSKSVINEFFYVRELKKSKIMYIALYQRKEQQDRFLGDFELDLTPYFRESCNKEIHHDLRNWKELHNLPNHMPKDMRRKGWIDFELVIKSNVKNFLDNLQQVTENREEEDEDEIQIKKQKQILISNQNQNQSPQKLESSPQKISQKDETTPNKK